ncbi:hypothetical protein [Flavisphingomonas formosensis]|uniref:hypothetical protein n=1 Tax=Flavisphingomonas formosensis TaxID=861534 RepID=UPI0012F8BD2D|nr:hypothetical protein [Sphingomonas formosensis]
MRSLPLSAALAALLLSGCNAKISANDEDNGTSSVSINTTDGQFSLDTKDLKANIQMPKMDMDAAHMDVDGVKLYPGTRVSGMNVLADDRQPDRKDRGKVTIVFSSGDAPARLLDYYRKAFSDRGYSVAVASSGDMALAAAKPPHKDVRVALQPEGAGSSGTIVFTGE